MIPTARKGEDLDKLREAGFSPVALELDQGESVRRAAAETLKLTGGVLGALVNNASYGQPGVVMQAPMAESTSSGPECSYLLLGYLRGNRYSSSEVFVASVSSVGKAATEFCLLPSALSNWPQTMAT